MRVLRAAGLPLGPAKVIDALAAVEAVGVDNRTDFREALAAVLVSRREHLPIFEQAFDLFWRNPRLLEKMIAALLPKIHGRAADVDENLPARLAQAMLPPPPPSGRGRGAGIGARCGVLVFGARGFAAQGLRDDDRRGAHRGEGAAAQDEAAVAVAAGAPDRPPRRAGARSICARRFAAASARAAR